MPTNKANSAATAQAGGPSLRTGGSLPRSFALAATTDRVFVFRLDMASRTIKNPEAFGLGVGMSRTESNRPSRPPMGANNHDAADNAGDGDGRLGGRDNHLKPGSFSRNDAVFMQG